jgi:hypothetical protein
LKQNWPYHSEAEKARCGFLACWQRDERDAWSSTQSGLVAFYVFFGWAVMGVVVWTYFFGFLQVRGGLGRREERRGG